MRKVFAFLVAVTALGGGCVLTEEEPSPADEGDLVDGIWEGGGNAEGRWSSESCTLQMTLSRTDNMISGFGKDIADCPLTNFEITGAIFDDEVSLSFKSSVRDGTFEGSLLGPDTLSGTLSFSGWYPEYQVTITRR